MSFMSDDDVSKELLELNKKIAEKLVSLSSFVHDFDSEEDEDEDIDFETFSKMFINLDEDDKDIDDIDDDFNPFDDASTEVDEDIDIARFIVNVVVLAFIKHGPEAVAEAIEENREDVHIVCSINSDFLDFITYALELGVFWDSDVCANTLGALYYMGDLLEQDYHKAQYYYQIAAAAGNVQATINLGYIYEYGRTGAPDYQLAYQHYALAAALSSNYEALYKLGDCYNRGRGVKENKLQALRLYQRSIRHSEDDFEECHAALRIAKLYMLDNAEEYGIEADTMAALKLFQIAEMGLRQEIEGGASYYKKQLQEAIEGQAAARALL